MTSLATLGAVRVLASLVAASVVLLGSPGAWVRPALGSELGPSLAGDDDPPGGALEVFVPRSHGTTTRVSGPLDRSDVPYSFRAGCPVAPAQLRRISIDYIDFNGRTARGNLIARRDAVDDLVHVFSTAYAAGFPIAQITPIDAFYAEGSRSPAQSDLRAMEADNTSAFNCRPVTGDPYRLSTHSFGIAIDINPAENPYVTSGHVYPSGSSRFLTRDTYRKGMILRSGPIAKAMASRGWLWGQRWGHPDYQHFSSNGG